MDIASQGGLGDVCSHHRRNEIQDKRSDGADCGLHGAPIHCLNSSRRPGCGCLDGSDTLQVYRRADSLFSRNDRMAFRASKRLVESLRSVCGRMGAPLRTVAVRSARAAIHQIHPRATRWREVPDNSRAPFQPVARLFVFVDCIVVSIRWCCRYASGFWYIYLGKRRNRPHSCGVSRPRPGRSFGPSSLSIWRRLDQVNTVVRLTLVAPARPPFWHPWRYGKQPELGGRLAHCRS
jgi:hypothetical protein